MLNNEIFPEIELLMSYNGWSQIEQENSSLCFIKEDNQYVTPNILIDLKEVSDSYEVSTSDAEIILYIKNHNKYKIISEGTYVLNNVKWMIREFIHTNEALMDVIQLIATAFIMHNDKKYSIRFFGTSTTDEEGKKVYSEIQGILTSVKVKK